MSISETLRIGNVEVRNRVVLAPMSGITDAPFRRLAYRLGAGLVVTEMIASEDLAKGREDVLRRVDGEAVSPHVVQLSGREPHWMAEGARHAADHGADIIDINMGCPAKQVTRGLSGSALMRDLDNACRLISAVIVAVELPVTLKMRMGWDENSLNAPDLARRAEGLGVRAITVHGRTRSQFFKGRADWDFIASVKAAVDIPVIANGDACSLADVETMLAKSRADGVMIGRGACGRPWFPGRAATFLETGRDPGAPDLEARRDLALEHHEAILSHYGKALGTKIARKHLGWIIDGLTSCPETVRLWRRRLCREDEPAVVRRQLGALHEQAYEAAA